MASITNLELLETKIRESGKSPVVLAAEWGISLPTYYSRKAGKSEFTAPEIIAATISLSLSKAERDAIFLEG